MFHDRGANNNINKIHERALRIAFVDTSLNFEELLKRPDSVTIHQRNLQLLAAEIYKTKIDLNPKFMNEIFVEKNNFYTLRGNDKLSIPNSTHKCIWHRNNKVHTGFKLWNSLPLETKESNTLTEF